MLIIYLIWQLTHLFISLLVDYFIPYQGFFAYPETLKTFNLPKYIYSLANFDGVYYLKIAKDGYLQFEQAFFPLFPLLIKIFSFFIKNRLLAGLLISNLCFLIGLFIFKNYLKKIKKFNLWTIIFLLAFPTSFFFKTVYTEGLFFLLLISFFYLFLEKKFFLAALIGGFASVTRINGALLIIPFLFLILQNIKKKEINIKNFIYPLLTISGLIIYVIYLQKTTNDPLAFLNAQKVFGANRSSHLIFLPQVYFRYLKIFVNSSFNYQYWVAVSEFVLFNFVFIILIFDLINQLKVKNSSSLLTLNLYSLANLILPTLTGTFSSIGRYSLMSISFFVFLSEIKSKKIKCFLTIIFSILQIIFFSLYLQGYFIS